MPHHHAGIMVAARKARAIPAGVLDRIPGTASRSGRALATFAGLLGLSLALWFGSSLLLDAFPVTLRVQESGPSLRIFVDGESREVPLARPVADLRLVPMVPNAREYQIDGSDTTNNFTFDAGYFAGIATTPYYRFQAFLRDEGSYSQWRNLVVRDPAGRTVLQQPAPTGQAALPADFDLTLQLRRLETPRTVELVDGLGTAYGIEVNRNDKYVMVTQRPLGQQTRELTHWYFPNDWRPPLAELGYMAMRVAALALFLIPLLSLLATVLPFAALANVGRGPVPLRPAGDEEQAAGQGALPYIVSRTVPLLAAAFVLAASCYTAVGLFDRAPHILDSVSYYFQAKILASGAAAAPAPPLKEAFPTPFMVIYDGNWFSQYPPGTSLVLAAGFLLQLPWLVEPVLAAAATLLVYAIGRRHYGTRVALLATVLMASSPFLWLMAGSFMSHVPSTFFAASFLYAATRYAEKPSSRWVVIGILALGFSFLVRETTALLYGVPVGGWLLWRGWRQRRRESLYHVGLAAAILALFGVAYLAYNWAVTGSPWLLPRFLFSPVENRFGFGDGMGFYGKHTPASGLVNADEQLTSLTIVLFGWPFYFSLALMSLPFVTLRTRRWDLMHGAIFGAFVVTYIGLYYHGIVMGPRYYFDALPSMVLLSARGFASLADAGASILGSIGGKADWRSRMRTAALLLAGALLACNLLYFAPREADLYRGFTGLPGGKGPALGDFVQEGLAGPTVDLHNALITTDDWWIYSVYLAPMNSPRLDGNVVLALMPPGEAGNGLKAAYAGRNWYRVVESPDGKKLVLAWEGVLPAR